MNKDQVKFREVVSSTLKEIKDGVRYARCPDQMVAKISSKGGVYHFTSPKNPNEDSEGAFTNGRINIPPSDSDKKHITTSHRIIIILESPHVDEFNGEGDANGPAYGKTGTNIKNLLLMFRGLTGRLKKGNTYSLILMNAIQYQCSMGWSAGAFTKKIFNQCWKDFGEKDFKVRVRNLNISETDILINACTNAGFSQVERILGEDIKFRLHHPCLWHKSIKTRELKDK